MSSSDVGDYGRNIGNKNI